LKFPRLVGHRVSCVLDKPIHDSRRPRTRSEFNPRDERARAVEATAGERQVCGGVQFGSNGLSVDPGTGSVQGPLRGVLGRPCLAVVRRPAARNDPRSCRRCPCPPPSQSIGQPHHRSCRRSQRSATMINSRSQSPSRQRSHFPEAHIDDLRPRKAGLRNGLPVGGGRQRSRLRRDRTVRGRSASPSNLGPSATGTAPGNATGALLRKTNVAASGHLCRVCCAWQAKPVTLTERFNGCAPRRLR